MSNNFILFNNLKFAWRVLTFILGMFCFLQVNATHYRAGEILFEQINGRLYRIIAITYTDPSSDADPATIEIEVDYGDGTKELVRRTTRNPLSSKVVRNVYVSTHTYRSDGEYKVSIFDVNRVNMILNINFGNTQNIAFYVESTFTINSQLGNNRSPILTKPPLDEGCLERDFYHNPAAYDPDGDSLVFELTVPKQQGGEPVPNYSDPRSDKEFSLGLFNGQLFWSKPLLAGIYNVAFVIKEFRNGKLIGTVTRDMQINIIDRCTNLTPTINDIPDGCVVVGDTIRRIISGSDPNPGQRLGLFGFGGPFIVNNVAIFYPNPATGFGNVSTLFEWKPSCNQIRYNPWQTIFEIRDDVIGDIAVSQNSFFVKVIGPPINNLKIQEQKRGFLLTWNRDTCRLAGNYLIYRRIDSSGWKPAACQTGIPDEVGFKLIGTINAINFPDSTSFLDNNNGAGLSALVDYCYRIVTVYPARNDNGAVIESKSSESIASIEVCDNRLISLPIITKVSVIETDNNTGKIEVNYKRPIDLDTNIYKPPYQIRINRKTAGSNPQTALIQTFSSFTDIVDFTFIDSFLNTSTNQYRYYIAMSASVNGVNTLLDSTLEASSVRAIVYSTDRTNILSWNFTVPWINDSFDVFRKNASNVFEKIATVAGNSYADTGLFNRITYCYVIQSKGRYRYDGQFLNNTNFSQEICGTPVDTVPPCPPNLVVVPPCNSINDYQNRLTWTTNNSCAGDVVKYRVYYKLFKNDPYILLAEVDQNTTSYNDDREILKKSITGCYFVAGVDSVGNESNPLNEVCVENCPFYDIPNVFTPNTDFKNDSLRPFPYRFVNNINIVIYNRWGVEVFATDNIDIEWNGKDQNTNTDLPNGVYFYICDVYEIYLEGIKKRTLKGTIQLIRD
jgi:gliding motility-associated-like protein